MVMFVYDCGAYVDRCVAIVGNDVGNGIVAGGAVFVCGLGVGDLDLGCAGLLGITTFLIMMVMMMML